jgi:hypothetical protein
LLQAGLVLCFRLPLPGQATETIDTSHLGDAGVVFEVSPSYEIGDAAGIGDFDGDGFGDLAIATGAVASSGTAWKGSRDALPFPT